MGDLIGPVDITHEVWREYEWTDEIGRRAVYRIVVPVSLYYRPGGTTHRIVDATGVAHCVPAPGQMGCVLRWFNGEGKNPVNF
jgi:hypothetical protein